MKKAAAQLDGGDFSLGNSEDKSHADKPYYIPPERIEQAKRMVQSGRKQGIQFILPVDFVLADGSTSETIGPGQQQFDIGPKTIAHFEKKIGEFIAANKEKQAIAFHNGVFGMGFLLGYFLEACMGLVGFWFGEIGSLLFVYMLFNFFLYGHMFPLDMLPGGWRTFVMATPLMYLAYFPAAVFLGKIHGVELYQGLAIELAWVVFFIILSRILFHRGLVKYSAYGG